MQAGSRARRSQSRCEFVGARASLSSFTVKASWDFALRSALLLAGFVFQFPLFKTKQTDSAFSCRLLETTMKSPAYWAVLFGMAIALIQREFRCPRVTQRAVLLQKLGPLGAEDDCD
ncbi:uncharacterized [Tachysurus ichikawai]